MAPFLLSYIFLAIVTSSSGAPSDDANIDEAVQQSKSSVQDMEKVIMKLKDDLIEVISFQRSNFAELRNNVADLRNRDKILEKNIANIEKNQEEFRSEIAQNKKDMETKMVVGVFNGACRDYRGANLPASSKKWLGVRSEQSCIGLCKQHREAAGCEYHHANGACAVQTHVVAGGSGSSCCKCWMLAAPSI